MPTWFRYPKGTYTRQTLDWYAHNRASQSIFIHYALVAPLAPYCVELRNNASPGVVMHIMGVDVNWQSDPPYDPAPDPEPPYPLYEVMFCRVSRTPITGTLTDFGSVIGPPMPFYGEDPTPTGQVNYGSIPDATYEDIWMGLSAVNTTFSFVRPWEIAAVPPGAAFQIYAWFLYIDQFTIYYYWAVD
jgi:hypothetical protein